MTLIRRMSAVVLVLATGLITTAPAQAETEGQRMAIPSYFYPGTLWQRMEAAAPSVGVVIANPSSGPGDSPNADYAEQIKSAQGAGIRVIGYVSTRYSEREIGEVRAEIDRYRDWYGVDGVFLDETTTGCGQEPYYEDLYRYVKQHDAGATVVLNPGTGVAECYTAASDILVNFESDYQNYTGYQPEPWVTKYPSSRFWHLVHGTTEQQLPDAMTRSQRNHAGWVYVTPDTADNPWDTLPAGSYWSTERSLLRAR